MTGNTTTSPSRPGSTFALLAVGSGVYSMLQSLIIPALPTVQRSLHTTPATVTWVMTAYLLSAAVFTPILGRVGDMAGKKRTLVAALAALAAGCVLAALAPDIGMLIGARILQGTGGAVLPLSFGIIRDEFPRDRVASAVGSLAAVIAAGAGLGIVLAGPVVGALDYHWLFWIPAIVVAATAGAAHLLVPESPGRAPGRVNWAAALLLSGWLVALLLPISEAPTWGWASPKVAGLLVAAAVLFAGWAATEARSDSPLIDLRILRLPSVWTTNLASLLFGAGMFALYVFLPQFTQIPASAGYGFGSSITGSGLLMLPMLVTMFVGGVLSGRYEHVLSARAQLSGGSALCAVACAALTAWHGEPWQVAAAGGVFGFGVGLAFSAMTNLIVRSVPPQQTGAASGMNANMRSIGGAIGAAAMSSIVSGRLQPSGLPYASGYTHGFAALAAVCLAAALVALLVPAATTTTTTVMDMDAATSTAATASMTTATATGTAVAAATAGRPRSGSPR